MEPTGSEVARSPARWPAAPRVGALRSWHSSRRVWSAEARPEAGPACGGCAGVRRALGRAAGTPAVRVPSLRPDPPLAPIPGVPHPGWGASRIACPGERQVWLRCALRRLRARPRRPLQGGRGRDRARGRGRRDRLVRRGDPRREGRGMQVVHLEDRRGRSKGFPLGPGFLLDGAPVVLTTPPKAAARAQVAAARQAASRTASGSRAVHGAKARVASGSRIFVEGRHDAELVERVWGHDLRVEGVVVEMLDGVDDLEAAIRDFGPGPGGAWACSWTPRPRHQGAQGRAGLRQGPVMPPTSRSWATPTSTVQSVRPERLGLKQWPVIPVASRGSTASATTSAGRPTARPTSPGPGSRSSAPCAATPTSSRPCLPASRSSSTS